jgi:hypothetical protein
LLSPVLNFFEAEIKENRIRFQLCGSFEKLDDSVKNFLFIHQFHLYCVADSATCSHPLRNTITDIAKYGFSIPCIWYVDEKNVEQILSAIDEIMNINLHSGFALPLSSERFFKKDTANPSRAKYLQLMTEVYCKYSYYDDVLYPLNDILQRSLNKRLSVSVYRWDFGNSAFQRVERDLTIDKIHDFLYRAFLWQRWIVHKTYQNEKQQR